jgi:small-conductance mechanosensitive channel
MADPITPAAVPVLLAQDPTGTNEGTSIDPEDIFTGDPSRPITELLAEWFGDGPLVELLGIAIDAIAQVLLIVVVASVALWLLRRAIDRGVARASDPDAPRGRRLRRRVGLSDSSPATFSARRAQRAEAIGALARSILGVVVWSIAVFTILGTTFAINLGPLVAGAGILGIAIGFGAQDLVKDFLSGVFMLIEDQYGVGDIIDVGEATGVVEGVTLRTTRIRDVTGTLWHVPNGEIARVGNKSQKWSRAILDVGVAYSTDIDTAIALIERVAVEMSEEDGYREQFLDAPDVWGVEALGADSVDIRLVIKTEPAKQFAIARELRRRIKAAFDTAGIEIPFPQRTLWLRRDQNAEVAVPDPVEEERIERAAQAAAVGDRGPEVLEGQDLPEPPPADEGPAGGSVDGSDDGSRDGSDDQQGR